MTAGLDDVPAALALLQARALDGFFEGDLEAVSSASSEGVRLSREVGDLYTLKVWLLNLGMAALIAGELGSVEAPVRRGAADRPPDR